MGHATTKPDGPQYQCPNCGNRQPKEEHEQRPRCGNCGMRMRLKLKQVRLSRR